MLNVSNTSHHEEDHHEDEHEHGSVGNLQVDICFLTLVMLFGIFFNCLILLVMGRCRHLRTSSNLVIVNLAIADLLVCAYIVPVVIVNRSLEDNFMGNSGCRLNSFIVFMAMGVSNASIMLIAIDRYCMIFHRHFHNTFVTKKSMSTVLLTTWLLWFLYALIILLIFHGFEYEPDAYVCFFSDSNNDLGSAIALTFFDFLLPVIIIIICYSVILARIFRSKIKVAAHAVAQDQSHMVRFKQELITLVMISFTVCLFVLCWAPYMFHSFWIRAGATLSPLIHKSMYWLALSNGALNGTIYSVLHTQFRKELVKIIFRKASVTSVNN